MEEELKYLEDSKKIIKSIIKDKEKTIEEAKKCTVKEKSFIWNNQNQMTLAEIYSKMDESDLSVNIINSEIIKVAKLYRSLESPYFGKLVFNGEKIYIGLTGVSKNYEQIIYDWRAPISNMYYNFETGPAYYEVEDEKIEGTISEKRQLIIEMGKLLGYFDSDVAIDDKILQKVLLSNRDEKMKNIVSTIQKEQNEVIRYNKARNLIIEGIAGSGKTEVALHRIAYQLYNMKGLTNKNVLILSPNDYFSNYISNVLPELGETEVKAMTYVELLERCIPDAAGESIGAFIDLYYDKEKDYKLSKLKMSSKYKEMLDAFIKDYISHIKFRKNLGLKTLLITSKELNDLLHNKTSHLSLSNRLNYIAEKLCDKWDISADVNTPKVLEIIKKILDINLDAVELYNAFLKENKFPLIEKKIVNRKNKYFIPYEDIFGILYLYFELAGYPDYSYIKQIAIDEAQDYTLNDYTLLKKIFSSATFTILGDRNQIINPCFSYQSLKDLESIFEKTKYTFLSNSYRSSAEITAFASNYIGLKNVKAIQKPSGKEVILKEEKNLKSDLQNDIEYLFKEGYKKIAIITKNKEETTKIKRIIDNDKIEVLPSYFAKGLEYDAVISYTNKDNKYTLEEKYLFYTVMTRAEHELIIYNFN